MSIEERANEYSPCISMISQKERKAYIKGAFEQRDIDIEKACDIMCGLCADECECNRDSNGVCYKKELIRNEMRGE